MSKHLVKVTDEKELVVTLEDISEFSGVKYESTQRLVRDNIDELNKYGNNIPKNAQGTSDYKTEVKLNEQQATLVVALMKKTPQVKEFIFKLVEEFFRMRELIKSGEFIPEDLKVFIPKNGYMQENKKGHVKTKPIGGYWRADISSEVGQLVQTRYELAKRLNGLFQEDIQLDLDLIDKQIELLEE